VIRARTALVAALLSGFPSPGAAQEPAALPQRARALAETGHLEEAERVARAGGAPLTVVLAEILRLRGRLASAESLFAEAARATLPGYRAAQAALAELSLERGDRAAALRRAGIVSAAYERDGGRWPAEDRTAAGRAYVVLGSDDPQAFRAALRAFDAAVAADPALSEPRIRLGDLFLDKYNAPDARTSYDEALRLAPNHPRALLGLAKLLAFDGSSAATAAARKSLAANPSLVPAHLLLGRLHLDAEEYDSAGAAARRALAVDSAAVSGWALLGAVAWLSGDSAGFARARDAAQRIQAKPVEFFREVAEAVARHRLYADAVRFGQEAVTLDSASPSALGGLGINELRLGRMEEGRAHLERAFARDPYNVWYKNTLDLLDEMRGFRTISTRRFRIVAPAKQSELLALYLGPLLEEAYDSLAARYEYRPTTPIRIELYDRHADFSVRTAGLTGIGALGVSFGNMLAMDSPSAREPGSFNWGSTAWHELTHAFTLGLSAHQVPRWVSEGLSVLEEHRARPGWGAGPSVEFLAAFKAGRLLPVSRLSEGFVRPSHPAELGFSYYEASLVCEMIERDRGRSALVAILKGYRDGLDTPGVLKSVLGMTAAEFDARFFAWLRERFAGPLAAIAPWDGKSPPGGEFVATLRSGRELLEQQRLDEAKAVLQRAAALFPEYAGAGAPELLLARVYLAKGDQRAAAAALSRHTARDESAWDANAEEARLRQAIGDAAGAAAALERMLWISPYQAEMHQRLASLAEQLRDYARALRERRAVVAMGPADPLEARYQLARALAQAGDVAAARREVLHVLETAPGFEKAQALLLELRKPSPEENRR